MGDQARAPSRPLRPFVTAVVLVILSSVLAGGAARQHAPPPAGREWGSIALLVAADEAFTSRAAAAIASKRAYCALHGYDFILEGVYPELGRSPHWGRIPALMTHGHQVWHLGVSRGAGPRAREPQS